MDNLEIITETSIKYGGRKYTRKSNGYYYNCSTRKHLHQAIWIEHNGPIPENCEIHHADFNKDNNDISNLVCMDKYEHRKLHSDALTDEDRQWRRNNLNTNARPKAIEWHKSDKGKEWHKSHLIHQRESGCFSHTLTCTWCGKEYIGEIHNKGGNTFCSNVCKARYLRDKRSKDKSDVRICEICGKTFNCSKWSKTKTCSSSCKSMLAYSRRGN